MKNFFKAVCMGTAAVVLAFSMAACGDGDEVEKDPGTDPETPAELQPGEITFEDAICTSVINQENSGTVDIAVASNGAEVTYSISEEEAERLNNAFENAISIAPDGTITGMYDEIKRFKVDITASAEKCESVTAEITISIVNPYLTFEGRQLADGREGCEYAASVAYVAETDAAVEYSLASGSSLPEGLTLSSDGTITGVPTTVGRAVPFTVEASAKGYSDSSAEFLIDVVINHVSAASGSIVRFSSDEPIVIENAFMNETYINTTEIARASALNNNVITYKVTEGTLPEGFTLYPNGALIGRTDSRSDPAVFTVEASAQGCPSVSCRFSFEVKATQIKYPSANFAVTKGEAANLSLAHADALGAAVKYTVADDASKALLAEYGLSLSEDGILTGTPTKSANQLGISITASAEGFTEVTSTMYVRINEPLQAPANGRFEAEYTDLSGKQGTGYSGSPTGVDMIDKGQSSASNGAIVSYMHNSNCSLEFVVYVAEAVNNVPLYICLGSEAGNVTLTPDNLAVYVYQGQTAEGSKTTVNYSGVSVPGGSSMDYTEFVERQFGTVNLAQGWNVIQIQVLPNDLGGTGVTRGPGVDYIRFDTSVSIQWQPLTFNM